MKYIKAYEAIKNQPQIGDYVICVDKMRDSDLLNSFLSENIGQYTKYNAPAENTVYRQIYTIQYERTPETLSGYFNGSNYRYMKRDEIIFFSPDKEDCEAHLEAKKYNL